MVLMVLLVRKRHRTRRSSFYIPFNPYILYVWKHFLLTYENTIMLKKSAKVIMKSNCLLMYADDAEFLISDVNSLWPEFQMEYRVTQKSTPV